MSKVMPAAKASTCWRCNNLGIYMFATRKGWRRVCEKCLRGEEKRRLTRYPNQHQYEEKNHAPKDATVRPQEESQGTATKV